MLDIIFRAPKIAASNFSSALVLPKYRALIDEINSDYILTPLSQAFLLCKMLDNKKLKRLKRAVHVNNKIRELCDGEIEPITYDEIEIIDSELKKAIKLFCDKLYDNVIDLAPCYNMYEEIDGYYKKVVQRSSKCRCCGINKVLTKFHTHRSALDHYLPRKHFPFNSVNFKNLLPICDICNSKYKLGKNPLCKIENKGRKNESRQKSKAFYPFRRTILDIGISIKFQNTKSVKSLEPNNIEIELTCPGYDDQIETWDRIFGIKENYKAECCTEEMLFYYEEQYMAEMIQGKKHQAYILLLEANKYGDSNFLKIPFLNALAT